ncbi:transcription/translation regulatory transformer protein RfaH [Marinimicrobium sp. C2-29]|uniref:transcription/translation regulatory transformer protein RfaH n=1 Tax=Marinimicrobium sp. C2-29 TaxID=3139825 RepID=UPI003138BC01
MSNATGSQITAPEQAQWYLVQCKPRETFRAEQHLANQGFDCFHPTHPVKRKRRDKIVWVTEPLFPHYLFIRLDYASNWGVIRSTRGVVKIVKFEGRPRPVSEEIVYGLEQHCAILHGAEPEPLFRPGEKVMITEGCFRELEAIVQTTKGDERVVLLLNLLNQPQSIELPLSAISTR